MSNEQESVQWLETMIDSSQRQDPNLFSRSLRPSPPQALIKKPAQEIEILRTLGEGGMGQVFLARQHSLDRQVAVKAIKPSQVGEYAQLAMLHEARIAGALEHPNVVPIHSLSQDADGLPLLVMKRIDGTSWKDLLKNPRHPYWLKEPQERLQQNIEILMQVCNALHFAHTKGVLHRDIKPENVMLGNFGEIYLLDWGIAVHLENGSAPSKRSPGPYPMWPRR
jgi:serine/threonine protein kinase